MLYTKQEFSFLKKHQAAKISVLLQAELKHILTLFVLVAALLESYGMAHPRISQVLAGSCLVSAMLFATFYSALFGIFLHFASKRWASYAIAIPAILLTLLLFSRIPYTDHEHFISISYGMVAGAVYGFWLLLHLLEEKWYAGYALCLAADAVMIYLYFSGTGILAFAWIGKIIYTVLFILSISVLNRKYPFAFFLFLMIFILCIPVRRDPINWDPVVDTGRKVIIKTREMASSFSYYLSEIFRGSAYYTGYSSYASTGDAINLSNRTEIELRTIDNPTVTHTDEESGKKIKRRRTVYLTGGRETDPGILLDILFSFYCHEVDGKRAYLFSHMSDMDISYVYLKTNDEIMPEYTFKATDNEGLISGGRAKSTHKKGYRLKSLYMELDLGSPYLEGIIASPVDHIKKTDISYKKMSSYAFDLYGIRLKEIVSEDDFSAWQADGEVDKDHLDTHGASDRLNELSEKITEGKKSEYEKCRAVESYLRQYKYNTRVTGTEGGNTKDAAGMGKLADDFLFDKGEGYCVHFSSAMVMLLRNAGIPARLASGYRYVFPFDRQDSYEVSGSAAHVWPEAYLSGFGWVAFEPTPAMSTAGERTWHRHPAMSEGSDNAVGDYPKAPYFSYEETGRGTAPIVNEELINEREEALRRSRIREAVRLFAIVLSAAVLTAALIILSGILIKRIRYLHASPEKRLIMDVKDIESLVRDNACEVFYDRGVLSDCDPYIPDKYREDVHEVFAAYYRIMYRNEGDTPNTEKVLEAEETKARELRKQMRNELKRKGLSRIDMRLPSWHNKKL